MFREFDEADALDSTRSCCCIKYDDSLESPSRQGMVHGRARSQFQLSIDRLSIDEHTNWALFARPGVNRCKKKSTFDEEKAAYF